MGFDYDAVVSGMVERTAGIVLERLADVDADERRRLMEDDFDLRDEVDNAIYEECWPKLDEQLALVARYGTLDQDCVSEAIDMMIPEVAAKVRAGLTKMPGGL